jgi:hypothetical protein
VSGEEGEEGDRGEVFLISEKHRDVSEYPRHLYLIPSVDTGLVMVKVVYRERKKKGGERESPK